MYQFQLNSSLFAVASALGISWEHLNHPNKPVRVVDRFHVYFINDLYCSICDDQSINPTETWMYGDWFYVTVFSVFGHNVKATERSPSDDLIRWIITQSKCFTRKGFEKISKSMMGYVYLVLTSQVQARSSVLHAQKAFKSTLKALINEDYSIGINIKRYQGVLEHALSKVDFQVGIDIYMLPSNLN